MWKFGFHWFEGLLHDVCEEVHDVCEEVKTLTGGPLGPMMDRPGSPGAPYRHTERREEIMK